MLDVSCEMHAYDAHGGRRHPRGRAGARASEEADRRESPVRARTEGSRAVRPAPDPQRRASPPPPPPGRQALDGPGEPAARRRLTPMSSLLDVNVLVALFDPDHV